MRETRGETEHRTKVNTLAQEDSITLTMKQFPAAVEFGKQSNIRNPWDDSQVSL